MKRFAELYAAIDRSTKTNEKLRALVQYFLAAPPEDAAWALFFLIGNTIPRPANSRVLRDWVVEATGIPLWLLEESYHSVGDLAETFALILNGNAEGTSLSLSELVEKKLLPMAQMSELERKESLGTLWLTLNQPQAFLLMKLITGSMRVGVQKTLLSRALSQVSGISQAQVAHRLMGGFTPSPSNLSRLLDPDLSERDPGLPYPFCLAYPLETPLEALGAPSNWNVEWKWDGIRVQAIRRAGSLLLWSRGEELISDSFPELAESLAALPLGTVLDGEILAWDVDKPRSFGDLQRRLGRKKVGKKMIEEIPTHFVAYDILEQAGEDIRELTTIERRARLEATLLDNPLARVSLSPLLSFASWGELTKLREGSREMRAEGCMLKAKSASYEVGRKKGQWWKWKVDPHTCDAVLIYAQRGHGRRAGLYTDYTFGVWKDTELVPVAKAYSGLTDEEFLEVNRFIKGNTIERFGPVVTVTPELVFELAFDDIRRSSRHKAGLALRFPRMKRFRKDKPAKEADSLETLLALMSVQ